MPLEFINPDTQTTATTSIATTIINNSAQTNYISFPVATANPLINGWRIYADSATTFPVDGTGGSPNTTLTQNTSSPLNSTGDFRLNKSSGASRQGEGFSTDFTIANRHLSKVLQLSFDYELVSGTLATDDIRLYVIQDPTSGSPVVLEPVNVSVQGVNTGIRARHLATFQTHISITSYRLCVHISTTINSSQIIDFNNFRVWETTQSVGSIITDWQNYTPTFSSANGFATTPSSINFISRRNGSNLEIIGSLILNTTNSNTARIPLGFNGAEGNVTIDGTKLLSTTVVGRALMRQSVPMGYIYNVLATGGNNYVEFGYAQNSGTEPFTAMSGSNFQSGVSGRVQINLSVPIAGWGSNVAMSSDSGDGRVVSATITGSLNTGASPTVNLTWSSPTILNDTHSAFNGTTGYTAPVSGFYQFNANFNTDSGTGQAWNAWVSGSNRQACGFAISGFVFISGIVFLLAGQNLTFRPNATGGNVGAVGSGSYFTISRVSAGSQTIGTNETVACSISKTSGAFISTNNPITSWNTKDLDTHSSFNLTNGTFTVPSSGIYLINASAVNLGNFTSYNQPGFTIRNGTTILSTSTMYFASSFEPELSTSALRRFVAGDIISLYVYGSGFGFNDLRMNISRIGI